MVSLLAVDFKNVVMVAKLVTIRLCLSSGLNFNHFNSNSIAVVLNLKCLHFKEFDVIGIGFLYHQKVGVYQVVIHLDL